MKAHLARKAGNFRDLLEVRELCIHIIALNRGYKLTHRFQWIPEMGSSIRLQLVEW